MNDDPSVPTVQDTGAAVVASLVSKVPVLGDALAIVVNDAYKRRMAVAEQTALDIAQQSGGADRLATRLAGDPQLEVLFLEAVEAATRTGLEDKRRLLSRVVGAAVLDDAKVEDGQLLVQALRELDAPHVRGLEMVRRVTDEPQPEDVTGDSRQARQRACKAAGESLPDPVRAALVRTGTLFLDSGVMSLPTHVTGFGRALPADLRAAADG